jgi:integrase
VLQLPRRLRLKLPRETGGRRATRTVFTPTQTIGIVASLKEPYATLALLVAVTGLRIGEAIAIKWSDFEGSVLHVSRRIFNRDVDAVKSLKSKRSLPLDTKMVERARALHSRFPSSEWVFCSEAGTPVNPGNALKRYLRPAVEALGLAIGGWHDFRHTLSTKSARMVLIRKWSPIYSGTRR